jgi:hypothetical protein
LVVVAIWGLTVTIAPQPKDANAVPASASIDAPQMMKDARNLPVQRKRPANRPSLRTLP